MKASCEGVAGRSMSLERVWSGGGGIGIGKLGALAIVVMGPLNLRVSWRSGKERPEGGQLRSPQECQPG